MPKTPMHCPFCDIIGGAGEVSVCYEDAVAIAFMDIQPVNDGHVLVVPRAHYERVDDLPRETGLHLYGVATRLMPIIQQVTGCRDLNIVVSSGSAAGQDVFHFHVHLIPRRAGDGFDVPLPFPGSAMPDRTRLDAMAARIISALRDPMASPTPTPAPAA
ncbi:HIT family protein [Roseisolibacter sp. H3M3-2]|uniref:HIT family protein n=1 Tax=Roseisolibacter sp. H3M3-2 TaxID=3031323 RepID=UPI0023D9DE0D|nr:HIT family protein [Roseisolibacter sp. H3M3-2]MDF1506146.1 HIT family protein [Roseisolibacter sp. H3M3-2]